MYPLDTNINTALERQADQVRAVRAYGSGHAAAARIAGEQRTAVRATVALAAATPIVLLAWGLMAR
jgi:hypothetical protein